ncbi:MAG: hypothetical protein JW838_07470 [Spirochaetes bacterium]|nr:hypothetical protein [Spirochaetota bacterium]
MKVIGVLAKTLKMETTDLHYRDQSIDRIEVTMAAQNNPGKKFSLTVSDFFLEIAFPASYMNEREFGRWRSSFEYELEQAFLKNVVLEIRQEAANYHVKVAV